MWLRENSLTLRYMTSSRWHVMSQRVTIQSSFFLTLTYKTLCYVCAFRNNVILILLLSIAGKYLCTRDVDMQGFSVLGQIQRCYFKHAITRFKHRSTTSYWWTNSWVGNYGFKGTMVTLLFSHAPCYKHTVVLYRTPDGWPLVKFNLGKSSLGWSTQLCDCFVCDYTNIVSTVPIHETRQSYQCCWWNVRVDPARRTSHHVTAPRDARPCLVFNQPTRTGRCAVVWLCGRKSYD